MDRRGREKFQGVKMQLDGRPCAAELRLLSERRGVEWPSVRGKTNRYFREREIRGRIGEKTGEYG